MMMVCDDDNSATYEVKTGELAEAEDASLRRGTASNENLEVSSCCG